MTSRKKLQVFISSTYTDLKAERQAAVEAILSAGHIPAGMELFSAGNESQLEAIRRWIDDSDVFMLILGARYGSIDPSTSLSYIETEYNYALERSKPIFATVITEEAKIVKVKDQGPDAIETDKTQELKAFRQKVLGLICKLFNNSTDIKLAVHETLADFERRLTFTGWISGRNVEDTKPLLEQLSRLQYDNEALREEIKQLNKKRLRERKGDPQADGVLAQKCDDVSVLLYEAGASVNRIASERHFLSSASLAAGNSHDAWINTRVEQAREEEKIQTRVGPTVQAVIIELQERGIEMDLWGFELTSYNFAPASYFFAELSRSLRDGSYVDRRFTFDRMGSPGGLRS